MPGLAASATLYRTQCDILCLALRERRLGAEPTRGRAREDQGARGDVRVIPAWGSRRLAAGARLWGARAREGREGSHRYEVASAHAGHPPRSAKAHRAP